MKYEIKINMFYLLGNGFYYQKIVETKTVYDLLNNIAKDKNFVNIYIKRIYCDVFLDGVLIVVELLV